MLRLILALGRRLNAAELCLPSINSLHGNRDELAIAATKFDVACAETKVTGRRHVSKLLLPSFKARTLLLRGARPNGLGMALFVRSGFSVLRQERFECS